MNELSKVETAGQATPKPVVIPVEAYISEDYARAERDKLWRKCWLQAGRVEDLPEVGSYITYEILDDSVLIVRVAEGEAANGTQGRIKGYRNVCTHRGRRLVDTPKGERNAHGKRNSFVCGFHAWTFELDGSCSYIQQKEEWGPALCDEVTRLGQVNVDTWGGFIWVNFNPDCEPLREFLDPAATMLEPFGLENMRPRWRNWTIFDCN